MWENKFSEKRFLCGDLDYPTEHTRVVSLP